MNPSQEALYQYALRWQDNLPLRFLLGLVGVILLMGVVRAILKRKATPVTGLLSLLAGGTLLLFALLPADLIDTVIRIPYHNRVRYIFGGVSLLVLFITLDAVRRTHLGERYALLWVCAALCILFTAMFPNAVALLRAVTGMDYDTAMSALVSIFVILVSFHFSLSFSHMVSQQTKLVQRVAILEAELESIRKCLPEDPGDQSS